MQITKKDVLWNYAATFLKIASSALLLPLILKMMPTETVGIWSVFITITAFTSVLDFGFSTSFTRNVTYIFSGVRTLKVNGFNTVTDKESTIEYGLLKAVISAMRWFYLRIALILLVVLITIGTYYVHGLLKKYNGNEQEVYIAWFILCVINTYNLYTLYYDALLQGRGLIKRSKQIVIIGQLLYLVVATILILVGKGIIAIVLAQASSVIVIRWMSYFSFFTGEIKQNLQKVQSCSKKEVLKAIYPNAVKVGLTSFGGFLVQRSAIIIGSLFIPLKDIASYGITLQLIIIMGGMAGIYTSTYQPKISHLRITQNLTAIKDLYIKGEIVLFLTYLFGGLGILVLGTWGFRFIGSKTQLLPTFMLSFAILISFLENNHSIAGGILLTSNEVPFFKASLFAGLVTILLLLGMFYLCDMRIWAMILAPGIAHLYNNWKWPYEVKKQLNITLDDIKSVIIKLILNWKSIYKVANN
jgi:O-antigen/teichoic acid export membrane protein